MVKGSDRDEKSEGKASPALTRDTQVLAAVLYPRSPPGLSVPGPGSSNPRTQGLTMGSIDLCRNLTREGYLLQGPRARVLPLYNWWRCTIKGAQLKLGTPGALTQVLNPTDQLKNRSHELVIC